MSTDLDRFVEAQADVIDHALEDLRMGSKRGHWMWFVFPQLRGLGRSPTAQFYGIDGEAEARRYLAHPVLGPRLVECVEAVLPHAAAGAEAVFGDIDAMKFRSCLTLFEFVADEPAVFAEALEAFYGGERDRLTLDLLRAP